MNRITQFLSIAVPALLSISTAHATLVNGNFETGNLNGWTALGNVSTVSGGVAYNYQGGPTVGTVTPDAGTYSALLRTNGVSAATLAAAMGISELTLEGSNSAINATNGSLLYQTVNASAGDSFRFRWNFVEQDYIPFDDWAFYGIKFNSDPSSVTKFASLATVGPGYDTTINGWTTLNVDITQSGSYTFYFGIVNALDTNLDSDLWIDGVQAQALPPVGSVPDGGTTLAMLGLAVGGIVAVRRKLGVA